MSSRAKARWAESANEIVIEAWRYARHLGRTPAERMAIYNVEIQALMRAGANALRRYANKRQSAFEIPPSKEPRRRP